MHPEWLPVSFSRLHSLSLSLSRSLVRAVSGSLLLIKVAVRLKGVIRELKCIVQYAQFEQDQEERTKC
jgi:hypothetical protein